MKVSRPQAVNPHAANREEPATSFLRCSKDTASSIGLAEPGLHWPPVAESVNVVLPWLFGLAELGAACVFVWWSVTVPRPRSMGAWLLLVLVSLGTTALLGWRAALPEVEWQRLVSPDFPAMIPWGRRTFSTGFWIASWLLPLLPFLALKLLLGDGTSQKPEALVRFRWALGYAVVHLLAVGFVFW